jgi:hypothetical protein
MRDVGATRLLILRRREAASKDAMRLTMDLMAIQNVPGMF